MKFIYINRTLRFFNLNHKHRKPNFKNLEKEKKPITDIVKKSLDRPEKQRYYSNVENNWTIRFAIGVYAYLRRVIGWNPANTEVSGFRLKACRNDVV